MRRQSRRKPTRAPPGMLAASRASRRSETPLRSPCCASQRPVAWFVPLPDQRRLRTSQPALPRPTHSSGERRSHGPLTPTRSFDCARTGGPSVRRSCSPAARAESAPRCDGPCAAACAAPCGRHPEPHPQNPPPPSASSVAARSSSAVRQRTADRLPHHAPMHAQLLGHARNRANPKLVLSTDLFEQLHLGAPVQRVSSVRACPNQSTRSSLGGPKQNAELGQIRIPKSSVLVGA